MAIIRMCDACGERMIKETQYIHITFHPKGRTFTSTDGDKRKCFATEDICPSCQDKILNMFGMQRNTFRHILENADGETSILLEKFMREREESSGLYSDSDYR